MSENLYGSGARYYDLFDLIFRLGGKGNPRSGLLEEIGNAPQQVLDLCAGTGSSAIVVAAANARYQVTGVDLADGMLAVARRKARQRGLDNLRLENMPADRLRFASGQFDVVMVSFALHEMEPDLRERVFREAARVLKPGGKFCVIDFARQEGRRNRLFIGAWGQFEPPSFAEFLAIDWHNDLAAYGLRFERERAFSFSKLYVLSKAPVA